jgi:hypothetical protein
MVQRGWQGTGPTHPIFRYSPIITRPTDDSVATYLRASASIMLNICVEKPSSLRHRPYLRRSTSFAMPLTTGCARIDRWLVHQSHKASLTTKHLGPAADPEAARQ